jgi:hypothetical protein
MDVDQSPTYKCVLTFLALPWIYPDGLVDPEIIPRIPIARDDLTGRIL